MPPIEGEIIVFDREKVEFQKGTFTFYGRKASFRLDRNNPELYLQAGQEVVHVWGSAGLEVGHVTLADRSLRESRSSIDVDGGELISNSNIATRLEREIPPGGILELEKKGLFRLTVRNK